MNLNNDNIRILIEILPDHCQLNGDLSKFGVVKKSGYRLYGEQDETPI